MFSAFFRQVDWKSPVVKSPISHSFRSISRRRSSHRISSSVPGCCFHSLNSCSLSRNFLLRLLEFNLVPRLDLGGPEDRIDMSLNRAVLGLDL